MLHSVYLSELWKTKVLPVDKENARKTDEYTSKKFCMKDSDRKGNYTGYLGENIIRRILGFEPCELYKYGGDGGVDILFNGIRVDVKCKLCDMEEYKPGFKFAVTPKKPGTRTSDILLLTIFNPTDEYLYILGAINTKEVDKIIPTKLDKNNGDVVIVQDIDVVRKVNILKKDASKLTRTNLFNFLKNVKGD